MFNISCVRIEFKGVFVSEKIIFARYKEDRWQFAAIRKFHKQKHEEKKKDFVTLFHSINVSNEDTLKNQEDKIVETLKSRHTQLKTDTISIASIYLHVPEEKIRFVGHTGLLVNTEDGYLYFEKYSNIAPFQATKFKDKKQVKEYLLSRPDLYGDGSEFDPIVTINDEILRWIVKRP